MDAASLMSTAWTLFQVKENSVQCVVSEYSVVGTLYSVLWFFTERTRPSVKLALSSTNFSAISDNRTSCIQLTAKFEIMFSTQNTHCGAPSWRNRSFSYWTDYMTGPRHSFQSYRTTGLPVFSSQQNLRSCLAHKIPTAEPSFKGKLIFLLNGQDLL